KTMGRGDELADRFEGESRRLADLEVQQRMAGRWVMGALQTSFAVMPAAVYLLGGTVLSNTITIPTIIAFTTLQARLFFPVGSLLGVGLDIQTSLALFDRIFEYLDESTGRCASSRWSGVWTRSRSPRPRTSRSCGGWRSRPPGRPG